MPVPPKKKCGEVLKLLLRPARLPLGATLLVDSDGVPSDVREYTHHGLKARATKPRYVYCNFRRKNLRLRRHALRHTDGVIAGVFDALHELGGGNGATGEEDGSLAAGEVDFHFVHAFVLAEGVLDRKLALAAVHTFNANDGQ
jgi:hypothetical protein